MKLSPMKDLDQLSLSEEGLTVFAECKRMSEKEAADFICEVVKKPEGLRALAGMLREFMKSAAREGDIGEQVKRNAVFQNFLRANPGADPRARPRIYRLAASDWRYTNHH